MTKDKIIVDEIFARSKKKSTPVLLKFQNGELKNSHKNSTLFFPAKCEKDRNTNHAFVVTSENIYSGPISDGSHDLVDTYICIRNKNTDKVRILPIDQAKLINHLYEDKEKTQFEMLTKDDVKDKALRMFGGRKDLRYINNRLRSAVDIDVFRDQLEATVENADITGPLEQEVSSEVIIDGIRPICNKEATNLESVYNVFDVIPLELMDRLDEEVAVLMTTDIEDIPITSEFLKKSIVRLKNKAKSTQTLLKMKIILYMDALLTLIHTKERKLKNVELSQITEKVENDIRKRFTTENDFLNTRTSITNEKALCYFLVLAFLLSDDFQLDMNTLATELCMSQVKIEKYGYLVNAYCRKSNNCLTLKLPSTVKPLVGFSGKRKRTK